MAHFSFYPSEISRSVNVHFTINWEVAQFSMVRNQTNGSVSTERTAEELGLADALGNWYIELRPFNKTGAGGPADTFLSVYLWRSPCLVGSFEVRHRIIIGAGQVYTTGHFTNRYEAPSKIPVGFGWPKLISHHDFFRGPSSYLKDDKLVIRAEVELNLNHPLQPAECLARDLETVFTSGIHSDFALVTQDGKIFSTHRAILSARSPVFAAMASDVKTKQVIVNDITGHTLTEILRFIYTGTTSGIEKDSAEAVLVAAHRFGLSQLKMACARLLCDVTAENAGRLLKRAAEFGLPGLKEACVKFMRTNLTSTNMGEFLIVAHDCRVIELKEAVLDFVKEGNVVTFCETDGFDKVRLHSKELMQEVFRYAFDTASVAGKVENFASDKRSGQF